jgi:hypothetical protein
MLMLALVSVMPAAAAAQSADEIVEKHLAALGGREALAKLTSRKATGTVVFTTAGGEFKGPIELYNKAPNKARALIKLDLSAVGAPEPMVIDQRFNGTVGHTSNNLQGDTEISGNQLENKKNNMFPSSLLNYKTNGVKLDVQPKETVEGKEYIVLLMTPKSGSAVKMYLDPATYLVERTWAKITSPDLGEFEQTGHVSDYRVVDGIKMPFKSINSSPQQTVTILIEKVENNVAIDEALFSRAGVVSRPDRPAPREAWRPAVR